MIYDSDYLFVYGTLRPSFTNPFAHFLRQHSEYVGDGSFPGILFDLGNYPGAIYQPQTPGRVYGSLYHLVSDKDLVLIKLDDYEGIGDQYQQPHEYTRTIVPVVLDHVTISCWVYVYNWHVSDKHLIPDGDYVSYCAL